MFLSVLGVLGFCPSVAGFVWGSLMETNDLSMEMNHRSSIPVKLEEENDGVWSRWVKTALGSCVLWCSHVKGKPLREMTTTEGQARSLRDEEELFKKTIQGVRLKQLMGVDPI